MGDSLVHADVFGTPSTIRKLLFFDLMISYS